MKTPAPVTAEEGSRGRAAQAESSSARGARAEGLAADFLTAHGYRVVARNHRCPRGEIDIVAWEGEVLCFVEVRARTPSRFGSPLETIRSQKMRRIVRAARHFVSSLPPPWPPMRFDAVGIELSEPLRIELVRAAFEA
jgi:putative endonuclease